MGWKPPDEPVIDGEELNSCGTAGDDTYLVSSQQVLMT
jgi:hypothetical protein